MEFPKDLKYTEEHEWMRMDGDSATIGITDHAQDALGDIVYLGDLPEAGDEVTTGDVIGVVESVKATSDIFSPVDGTIEAVNEALEDAPELVNESPFGEGWIVKIKLADPAALAGAMDVDAYKKFVEEEQ